MTTITKERIELFIKNPLETGLPVVNNGTGTDCAGIAGSKSRLVFWFEKLSRRGYGMTTFTREQLIARRRGDY